MLRKEIKEQAGGEGVTAIVQVDVVDKERALWVVLRTQEAHEIEYGNLFAGRQVGEDLLDDVPFHLGLEGKIDGSEFGATRAAEIAHFNK